MRHLLLCALPVALLGLLWTSNPGHAQQKLASTGWGSLSGKVTFNGDPPAVGSFEDLMKKHADAACCLAGKKIEKIEQTWLIDPKTKGVANVMVWVKTPAGKYLPTHDKYKNRKEEITIDQPHCAFIPRIAAFNPYYRDGAKKVPTGQTMVIKNSAVVAHNTRAIGSPSVNPGFNYTIPPKTEIDVSEKVFPQFLPININCDIHPWMAAKLFVFDHPYYALTKEDGSYEIPIAPAGAEISIMAWHEGVGYVLPKGKMGEPMTLKEGKNTFDFHVNPPKMP